VSHWRRRWAIKRLYAQAAYYERLRALTDNFGMGPLLRYGEDRWGTPGLRNALK
jgi:hypothetical protein